MSPVSIGTTRERDLVPGGVVGVGPSGDREEQSGDERRGIPGDLNGRSSGTDRRRRRDREKGGWSGREGEAFAGITTREEPRGPTGRVHGVGLVGRLDAVDAARGGCATRAGSRAGCGGCSETGSGRASRRVDVSRDHTKVPRRREAGYAGARSGSAPAPPDAPAVETTRPRGTAQVVARTRAPRASSRRARDTRARWSANEPVHEQRPPLTRHGYNRGTTRSCARVAVSLQARRLFVAKRLRRHAETVADCVALDH